MPKVKGWCVQVKKRIDSPWEMYRSGGGQPVFKDKEEADGITNSMLKTNFEVRVVPFVYRGLDDAAG